MKHVTKVVAKLGLLASVLGALTACTGSFEPPSPTLLIVGYQNDGAKVALIQDDLLVNPNRLTFLPGSVRPLPAPGVDYDIVDREGSRRALVVLSRSVGTGSATASLTTLSLTGIDPANPVNFAQQSTVVINDFTPVPEQAPGPGQNPTPVQNIFCPSRVQVTQGGDYAAVLNNPSLCGLQQQPFIDILDLRGLRLLDRLPNVSPSGLYLSQGAAQDLLYYATPEAGSLRLQRATLPRPGQVFSPGDEVESVPVIAVSTPAGQNDAVDLQRAGDSFDERLVFLFRNRLVDVTGFGIGDTAEVGDPTETPPENASVVRDDERIAEGTFILSTPEAGIFTYLPPQDTVDQDTEQESTRVSAVDAVLESNQDLIYFVSDATDDDPPGISLFDLGAYRTGSSLSQPNRIAVPQLSEPSFITWTQSAPQATQTAVPTP